MALDAAREMMEDEDLEEGELSGSDTEETMSGPRTNGVRKTDVSSASLNYRTNTSVPPSVPYRSVKGLDSSEESASDSDDEDGSSWKRKRQKLSNLAPKISKPLPLLQNQQKAVVTGGAKNNIWGAVLQEQSQEAVAAELGFMDMEGQLDTSRQVEAYNYVLARKLREKANKDEQSMLDKELDEYMQDDRDPAQIEETGHLKRKRPVKDRLGPRLEMDYKGRYDITEGDSEDKVYNEIAYRLREPKTDLIQRVVKILGTKKSIELLMETAEVEQNGGLFILNGSRRRTPGGVFLNLLKNTPSITNDQVKEIFYMENQKEYEGKKAAKKRRQHLLGKKMKKAIKGLNFQEHDDTSRETFASDTNEALASLDEEHTEIKVDTEDAIEIDHSHDLETF
ncbi:hypothetical protein GDO86_002146 [Hymenochirus boettgeri]|uniref:Phosphorylated adapter RNA export protein n=1 Tax=Hymenochirus boettgeri TaxID=247094 RepID=A0A8T2K226_9PIPI|nr:hypothetical protein GDO86_014287 [Hymenochirus boettgeri]KAG8450113.1 hypothetical protein GDO86_002658 [Hymenochirus boettgeri]KAG8455807.1 hypothetical protein GDO86_001850 [Hymenochirus boettgeri]KAG8456237.1 hypothetical protein GDO86_002146 [Hymenochirus boettgeri]